MRAAADTSNTLSGDDGRVVLPISASATRAVRNGSKVLVDTNAPPLTLAASQRHSIAAINASDR